MALENKTQTIAQFLGDDSVPNPTESHLIGLAFLAGAAIITFLNRKKIFSK